MLDIFDFGNWDSEDTWWDRTIVRIKDQFFHDELLTNLNGESF